MRFMKKISINYKSKILYQYYWFVNKLNKVKMSKIQVVIYLIVYIYLIYYK